jgi:hypothetical protein
MTIDSVNSIQRKKFYTVLRRPLFFIVINFFLINTLFGLLPNGISDITYNFGRIAIIFYTGWLVVHKKAGGRWHAALAGTVIYFIDHVALKGGIFLMNYFFKPDGLGLTAFSGVIVSFIIFIPLSMLISMLGGLYAQFNLRKTSASME